MGLRQKIDALKARVRNPAYFNSESEQDQILLHFTNRAVQIGEACFLVSDLRTPLFVLARVLCEDFFLMFWIAQSAVNAATYLQTPLSSLKKMARLYLTGGRAKIIRESDGVDFTQTILSRLNEEVMDEQRIAGIAQECGLSKVYDLCYRFWSLEVHGRTYGLFADSTDEEFRSTLEAVNSLLTAIIVIVDKPRGTTTSQEILEGMGIATLGGR